MKKEKTVLTNDGDVERDDCEIVQSFSSCSRVDIDCYRRFGILVPADHLGDPTANPRFVGVVMLRLRY